MFKCVDDGVNYDDFHHDITLYSPCMIDDYTLDLTDNGWTSKPPDQWQPIEVADWIRNWAHRNEVQDIEIAHLLYNQMSGCDLCQMQREYFTSVCPQYAHLTFEVQSSLLNYSPSNASVSDSDRESTSSNLSRINERRLPCNSYYPQVCLTQEMMIDSTRSSTNGSSNTPIMSNGKDPMTPSSPTTTTSNSNAKRNGRRGRPPKKENKSRSKGNGKLWEFIRDLLLNPLTNPSLIRWERREDGIFKFIQSDKVAKMWGERKQNPRMTYEKLSRAMRYYYKSKVLLPVFGRRLVYKFGPNATGWRPQFDMILNKNGTFLIFLQNDSTLPSNIIKQIVDHRSQTVNN
ncbi:hypothetical protein BLOT_005602 [Blomia tropicalis]|nr:hypothetical protein BLOT_005602 [Blomia tropicalis]